MSKSESPQARFIEVETPIGAVRIEGTPDVLTNVWLPGSSGAVGRPAAQLGEEEVYPALAEAADWLQRYFGGEPVTWWGNPMPQFEGFRKRVYEALCQVPFGATVSYGELARMVGSPGAARAVGRVMATNPLALLVPCHRVIGADGALCGYGGSLPLKRQLLEHEGVKVK